VPQVKRESAESLQTLCFRANGLIVTEPEKVVGRAESILQLSSASDDTLANVHWRGQAGRNGLQTF